MTGSPNLTIVPDPVDLSRAALGARHRLGALRRIFQHRHAVSLLAAPAAAQAARALEAAKSGCSVVGLEVEWYLLRLADDQLSDEQHRRARHQGPPIRTVPVETGYSYHSESNFDLMQPVLSALARAFEAIDLPLRSIENEWGPGQVECTFAPTRRADRPPTI